MKYLVIVEKAEHNYSAFVPDLPGCIATGETPEQTHENMREAVEIYLDELKASGEPVPEPSANIDYVTV